MENEKTGAHARTLGTHIQQRLRELRELQDSYPCIGDVRGMGLMIGAEIVKPDKSVDPVTRDKIVREGYKQGIMLLGCGESVIRFSPPLVMTEEEADKGLERFEEAVKRVVG